MNPRIKELKKIKKRFELNIKNTNIDIKKRIHLSLIEQTEARLDELKRRDAEVLEILNKLMNECSGYAWQVTPSRFVEMLINDLGLDNSPCKIEPKRSARAEKVVEDTNNNEEVKE